MKIARPAFLAFLLAALSAAVGDDAPEVKPPRQNESLPPERWSERTDIPPELADLDSLVREIEDLYRADSSISSIKLKTVKPKRTRELTMKIWTRGEDKALVVIQSPVKEKGTATLKVDKNLWNYLPKIRRTIRIPPSMMQSSWMGSDFTNDDLVHESSLRDDYVYEFAGPSDEPAGWKISFTAKPDVVGLWERIDFVVALDPIRPVQAEYFDRKGRLSRTMTWSDLQEFDGKKVPAVLSLVPHDEKKEGHRTEMRYLDIDFDAEVPKSTFSLSELERNR